MRSVYLPTDMQADHEEDVFLAEMVHNDTDANKSWSLRVGHGGNIYSYIGAYGEVIPPQFHVDAPYIDEVSSRPNPHPGLPPLATDNLLENTDGVLSGRHPATFYQCLHASTRAGQRAPLPLARMRA